MADGFLSRWSRRKVQADKADEPMQPAKELAEKSVPPAEEEEAPPLATLEDVEKIDRFAPDFSAFMQPNVDPAVQQAALKKMFTDPHFNIMDGLDIYIDDYSKPDPLPPGMLERMAQSDMLKLFQKQAEPSKSEGQKSTQHLTSQDQTDLTSTPTVEPDAAQAEPVHKKNT
ncbi:DUF3306 domain-containing protein [Polynucleobacter sp. MWH-Svant-W18]|nr:DUF3306 domain-containing protein [Polynucleobacter sp. MWH-Svant-W18]